MSVGERVAFGEYVRARSGALLRAAQALTANRADAEDLLQATLVKAYQSWDNVSDPAALDTIIEAYETKVGPHNGARVVAKAWSDPAFKRALLEDGSKAVASLGLMNRVGDHLIAVENTPKQHNMIVCTLCSCYPWEVLGLPPVWYKSAPYRSRAVNDPRGVLTDFGVTLPADTQIRVWDSTAETRFIVLPMRPAGTEGWSEEKLATLVTRDCMIGTGLPKLPSEVA